MESFVLTGLWLAVCIWASFVVARRVEERRHRVAYYLLTWLVPFIGAAASIFLTFDRELLAKPSASVKMFEEVVESYRRNRSN